MNSSMRSNVRLLTFEKSWSPYAQGTSTAPITYPSHDKDIADIRRDDNIIQEKEISPQPRIPKKSKKRKCKSKEATGLDDDNDDDEAIAELEKRLAKMKKARKSKKKRDKK